MKSNFKVLLLYKNSTYANYFLSGRNQLGALSKIFKHAEVKRFKKTHDKHFQSLLLVEHTLKMAGIDYLKLKRGVSVDYRPFNLIITVGGDGTFLEASRHIKDTLILGINSDPSWSVGNFCTATVDSFPKILNNILKGTFKTKKYQRLQLQFLNTKKPTIQVLNDVLVSHINPAALSRYYLKLGSTGEEQRGSGIWISTAVGSSGAIHSAGGKVLSRYSHCMQYKPRELYAWKKTNYRLKGGVFGPSKKLMITSFIREGVLFTDGAHHKMSFGFGQSIQLSQSPHPLNVVVA